MAGSEIKMKMSLDSSGVKKSLEKTKANIKQFADSSIQKLGSLSKVGMAGLVAGFATASKAALSYSKEMTNLANVAGVGFVEFQKLAAAAKTVGIEKDKMADILKDVNDKMGDFLETGGLKVLNPNNTIVDYGAWLAYRNEGLFLGLNFGTDSNFNMFNYRWKIASISEGTAKLSLRTEPKKLIEKDIRKMLARYDFYDDDLNWRGSFANDFVDNGDGTITDNRTGLMWQKSGSSRATTWKRARTYVKHL